MICFVIPSHIASYDYLAFEMKNCELRAIATHVLYESEINQLFNFGDVELENGTPLKYREMAKSNYFIIKS